MILTEGPSNSSQSRTVLHRLAEKSVSGYLEWRGRRDSNSWTSVVTERSNQLNCVPAPPGRGDRTDGWCGSAARRSDCAKHLSRNLLPIRPCAVGASRTTTFSQTLSTIHRLRFSMPGEPVRATEWRLGTCRDWIRRRHQTRDETDLPAPTAAASRHAWP